MARQQELMDRMTGSAEHILGILGEFKKGLKMDGMDGVMRPEGACETPLGVYDYLMDNLGMSFVVDEDLEYEAVFITMQSGGPEIRIDTWNERITGYWDTDNTIEVPIPKDIVDLIDEVMETDYYSRMV